MISTKTSEFKARLSHLIGLARSGREVIVKDRDTPVARLVPFKHEPTNPPLVVTPREPAAAPLGKITVRAVRIPDLDTASLLRDDRNRR